MIDYFELYKIVKSKLSQSRFEHTIRVVNRAIEYANIYNIDENEVKLCALSHDIAKELDEKSIAKYYDVFDEIEKLNNSLWHSKIGAIICVDYGFNEDMLNAIKYHTTGRKNMSMLEKIIFLADATEEKRKFGSKYYELVKYNIDKAMVMVCSDTIKYLIDNNKIIHTDTINCYNYYSNILNTQPK